MIPVGILTAASTSSLDPATVAFNARVTAAGGTLTNNEKTAINTLVLNLKANNIWNSLLCIYPMVGASAASCAQNLKSASYTGSFVGGWTFSSTGAKPNGTTGYMDTNFNFFIETIVDNCHISMYSRTQDLTNNGYQVGGRALAGGSFIGLTQYYASVGQKTGQFYEYPGTATISTLANTLGFLIGSRISNISNKLYFNNSLLTTNNVINTAVPPNCSVYLAAFNRPYATTDQFSTQENAFTSFGNGLNDTEASNFYTAVQAFQTTLLRQV